MRWVQKVPSPCLKIYKTRRNGVSARDTQGASEDPYERRVKKSGRTGAGSQGLSLTGSWSCTTDSMDIDGRDGGLGTGQAGQRWEGKGRQLMRFINK